MKTAFLFFTLPLALFAHMEEPNVVHGSAQFQQVTPTHLEITTHDATIINCKSFNIPEDHTVKIVQPSAKSRMLTRVRGNDPSKILGKLESIGKVFLINPNGIVFGPNSVVSTGALIASTLDISNENFQKGNFCFQLTPEGKGSKIINHGTLTANLEGEIVLMAPHIINEGIIHATAGRVALVGAPIVTLDLTGDHLVSFAVEGELEQGIIQQLGKVACEQGDVYLRLSAAKKVIESVVNKDGLIEGHGIINENGVVRIAGYSEILARNTFLDAATVEIAGKIDSQNLKVNAEKTYMRTDIHAGDSVSFKGDTVVNTSNIVISAGGKKGIDFQDTLTMNKKLSLIAPVGTISLGKVNAAGPSPLEVVGKRIEVNQPIRTKSSINCTGETYLAGNITAAQSNITFDGPVVLAGNTPIVLSTGASKGDVRFNGPVDGQGAYSALAISAGDGSVAFHAPIGETSPLNKLQTTAKDVQIGNVGGESSGIEEISMRAKNNIDLKGNRYNAGKQTWEAAHFIVDNSTQFISRGQDMAFERGVIVPKGETFHVNAGEGELKFFAIEAAKKANISLSTGTLSSGEISAPFSPINIQAKHVNMNGSISGTCVNLDAKGDIVGGLSSHKIISKGDVYLNSREGSIQNKLAVYADQKIYVGSPQLVYLQGASIDNILHPIPGNAPPAMIFNDWQSFQHMGDFFENLEDLLSSLAPHLSSKKRGDYIDTTIVNLPPPLLYYKP